MRTLRKVMRHFVQVDGYTPGSTDYWCYEDAEKAAMQRAVEHPNIDVTIFAEVAKVKTKSTPPEVTKL